MSSGRTNSAELPAKLQSALDQTAALVKEAAVDVAGAPPVKTIVIDKALDAAPTPAPERAKPVPPQGDRLFAMKAPWIMAKLMDDFRLSDKMAAGILGNIGHECAGFRLMQEVKPLGGGRGGFGWAQWTGVRRTAFEKFCDTQGLLPTSDKANYAFLKLELETTHKAALNKLRATKTLRSAVVEFEKQFERAHKDHKHYNRRENWAKLAFDSIDRSIPAAVASILDPDQIHQVAATAKAGNAAFWVIDQFSDEGGQALVRQTGEERPEILLSDTTVFPLPVGLVPAAAAALLSKDVVEDGAAPPAIQAASAGAGQDVSHQVFAESKKCNGTLVSRNVPGTNGGRLGCAWAVNEVFRRAIGRPIGGNLSTVAMTQVLRNRHTPLTEADLVPGTVVMSPTQGNNVGHVGILGELATQRSETIVYSNKSSRGVFSDDFTLGRWKAFYNARKGLPVLFFSVT